MAAVKEPTVSKPDASEVWMAMRHDLRLVIDPTYPIYGPGGRVTGQEQGKTVKFTEGVLRVPHKGTVTLEDGGKMDADELRTFLHGHKLVGDQYMGFWKVDPVAPPIGEEELGVLMDAMALLDVDKLQSMLADERGGWGREALIRQLERAIEKVHAIQTAPAEEPKA